MAGMPSLAGPPESISSTGISAPDRSKPFLVGANAECDEVIPSVKEKRKNRDCAIILIMKAYSGYMLNTSRTYLDKLTTR